KERPAEVKEAAPDEESEEDNPTIVIHLLEGENRDFKVKRNSIKSVEYYEDMLMAEGDRLTQFRQYPKAFEHYLAVKLRAPSWPGLDERADRLLFNEGSEALLSNDPETGLRLLRELHARRPGYP